MKNLEESNSSKTTKPNENNKKMPKTSVKIKEEKEVVPWYSSLFNLVNTAVGAGTLVF